MTRSITRLSAILHGWSESATRMVNRIKPPLNMDEASLHRRIAEICTQYATPDLSQGPGDDAAVLHTPAHPYLLHCSDLFIEGTHFKKHWCTLAEASAKAISATVSDIAAMGGYFLSATLSLACPQGTPPHHILEAIESAAQRCHRYGGILSGGDLSHIDGPIVIDISALGHTAHSGVKRDGAQQGDALCVVGLLGESHAVLLDLLDDKKVSEAQHSAFMNPVAKLKEGQTLSSYAHAMTDCSDGLLTCLQHLLQTDLDASIHRSRLPIGPVATEKGKQVACDCALYGGEDYALVAALNPQEIDILKAHWSTELAPLSIIGHVQTGTGTIWLHTDEQTTPMPIAPQGYRHFHSS